MATKKRLIDPRWLTSQFYQICEACQTENIFIDAIIDEIDNAPKVDAVEVTRCKDCNKFHEVETLNEPGLGWCDQWHCVIRSGEFCSYGEKERQC